MTINLKLAHDLILTQLEDKSVLANLVRTVKSTGAGRKGASVDVLVEYLADVTVKTYTKANKDANVPYVYDQFSLTPIVVTLDDEIYAALEIDGWDNLDLGAENVNDFMPVITTLANRVKSRVETAIGTLVNGLTGADVVTTELTGATKAEQGKEIITALQSAAWDLNENEVPAEGRFAIVGREAGLKLLATDELLHSDKAGEATSQALRAATIGTIAGFTVVQSDAIDSNAIVVFQEEAFLLVSRAPGKHVAAVYSELATLEGAPVDLRVNVDGLGTQNSTGLIVSTFFKVAQSIVSGATSNPRAKKLVFTDTVAN